MNSKQRLTAAFKGEKVDRVPFWPREGFPSQGGPAEADDFRNGWQSEPLYRDLYEYVKPHADHFAGFSVPCQSRLLMTPSKAREYEIILDTPEKQQSRTIIHTPEGDLEHIRELRHWQATGWNIKEAVRSPEELEMLALVPFELDEEAIEKGKKDFLKQRENLGDEFMLKGGISSPMVCISGAMPLELFLEMSFTHRDRFLELCEEITQRYLAVLEAFFTDDIDWTDVAMNIGGSEQCTPPMMPPTSYDELVVPFDGRLIDFFKSKGILVTVHCHGKVSHALKCMLDMGVDATDPVEPPPAGDVTFEEAQEITEGNITLQGNMELDVLENGTPEQIRGQVKDMFKNGNRRIVVTTSAGPMEAISEKFADNYRTYVDAILEYGG